MSGGRILWGQALLVLGLVILGIWGGTQWTAWRLGFQPALGEALSTWGEAKLYPPWSLFWWWFAYEAYAPRQFYEGAALATGVSLSACLWAALLSVWRSREPEAATTYGSARWAQQRDLKRAGLLAKNGLILGRWGYRYLRHDGPEHLICFAPTRSGKGVGLVVPSLLTWPGSALVHDIKGENWTLTAGWRARFGRVLRFDPTDRNSPAYNPLLEVRPGASEVRDVQNIADILVDPEGGLERRNHWDKAAHALLVGVILHVLYAEPDKTLAGVARFLSDPDRPIEAALRAMMATRHLDEGPHPVAAAAARAVLDKAPNERSGVISTALNFLGLYCDPVVAAATRRCDFRIEDLVRADRPLSLYLVVPPSDLSRTKPLIRLMLNQIGRRLTEDLAAPRKRDLLVLLDEFPALGRLDFFESALAFMAGYGLRACLIAQSLNQIDKAYGPNNAILDNCHLRIAFATNDERTAKRISDALGTTTERRAMHNYAGHRLNPWLGHVMVSRQETARPLLTPGEVMQLPPSDALVLAAGAPPVRAMKIRYFEDPQLARRILPPPLQGVLADSVTDAWTGRRLENGSRASDAVVVDEHEPIAPPPPEGGRQAEFDFSDEEDSSFPSSTETGLAARLAALDPDDGVEL